MTSACRKSGTFDPRKQRGLELFRTKRDQIRQPFKNKYRVPSQTGSGSYWVDATTEECTCPDYRDRQQLCKHGWMLRFHTGAATVPDDEKHMIDETKKYEYYDRHWPDYKLARGTEDLIVPALGNALLQGIEELPYKGTGRRRCSRKSIILTAMMATFHGKPFDRAYELTTLVDRGLVKKLPSASTLYRFLAAEETTAMLQGLISSVAAPLVACEDEGGQQYAIDGTGFKTTVYGWRDDRPGEQAPREREYLKTIIYAGTRTHGVIAVRPFDKRTAEQTLAPTLVKEASEHYPGRVAEVSLDALFYRKDVAEAIARAGASPVIDFPSNSARQMPDGERSWRLMWHTFHANHDRYKKKYNRRSNVETVFNMVKPRFGDSVTSTTLTAQFNEILLKFLCHNLVCINYAMYLFGIEPEFREWFGLPATLPGLAKCELPEETVGAATTEGGSAE